MCERTSATSESSITLTETLGLLSIQTSKRTFRYASSAAGIWPTAAGLTRQS